MSVMSHTIILWLLIKSIGVDSWGSPGMRPPIIKMGANPLFAPPANNQTRILNFFNLKKT